MLHYAPCNCFDHNSAVTDDEDEVSRRLADSPALATTHFAVGATRQHATGVLLADIAHHLYEGDTALQIVRRFGRAFSPVGSGAIASPRQ